MNPIKMILLWVAWFGLETLPASAATYYVATNGSNAADGGAGAPWATPGYASKQLQAGDTLIIRGGVYTLTNYYDDIVWGENSGEAGAWITVRGEEGSRPVLQGVGNLSHAVNIADKSFLQIENLELCSAMDEPFSGGLRDGINGLGSYGQSNIVIRNVNIHHVDISGIAFDANIRHVLVEGCHIHHTGYTAISGDGIGEGEPGWQDVTITNCILEHMGLYQNGQEVPSGYDRPDGVGFERSLGPVVIANTIAREGFGDGLDSKSAQTLIRNCVVADNYGDGVKLWGGGSRVENTLIFGTGYTQPETETPWCLLTIGTVQTDATFEVVNCTLFDDSHRANNHYAMSIQYDESATPIDLLLRNNIIAGLGSVFAGNAVRLAADHNVFYNRAVAEQIQHNGTNYLAGDLDLLGAGNIYADPLFASATWGPDGDFHLQAGSPAIGGGTNFSAPVLDLDAIVRGTPPCIGAYEFRFPPARFGAMVLSGDQVVLGWDATNSLTYDLQKATNLIAPVWSPVSGGTNLSTPGDWLGITNAQDSPLGFYRILQRP